MSEVGGGSRRPSKGDGPVVRRGSKVGRKSSKGRSSSKEATAVSAATSKQVYVDTMVKPTLQALAVMVFAENPIPLEDPVSFLIEKLVQTKKLKPPETGQVDQKELQKLRETTSWLRGKMAQIDVIEEKTQSYEDPPAGGDAQEAAGPAEPASTVADDATKADSALDISADSADTAGSTSQAE